MIRLAWYTIALSLSFAHLFSMEKDNNPKTDSFFKKIILIGAASLSGVVNGLEMLYGVDGIDDEFNFDVNSVGSREDWILPSSKKSQIVQK